MNIQYAIQQGQVYVLEVNPRASRTVPYVSKAVGVPLAKIAARLMVGCKLASFGLPPELPAHHAFVKSPVFPFQKPSGTGPGNTDDPLSSHWDEINHPKVARNELPWVIES